MSPAALRDAIARDRAAGVTPIAVVATLGHHVDDQRRSGRRDCRHLRARRACGSTRTRPMPAWPPCIPEIRQRIRGLGARRLDRRQPAQVAVRAGGSQRLLHPAHGRAAAGLLARARVPAHRRGHGGRAQPDGHGRAARPPLPRPEAVDGAAHLRRGGAARAARPSTCAWPACSLRGWTRSRRSSAWPRCPSASCASARCRRASPAADLDAFNERLLEAVNAAGDVFLSHTRLNGAVTLRLADWPPAHDGSARGAGVGATAPECRAARSASS